MNYYVAHNDKDVFHYGKYEEGLKVDSGQPYFDEFETEQELIDFLTDKGVDYQELI